MVQPFLLLELSPCAVLDIYKKKVFVTWLNPTKNINDSVGGD
jgi:hypothetical protein